MSEDTKKKEFMIVFPTCIEVVSAIMLICFTCWVCFFSVFYFFKGPVKEFVNTFSWYVSASSVSDMTAKETKELAHLMSKIIY